MSSIVLLFGLGYVFHWAYKGLDKVFYLIAESRRKNDEK